MNNLELIGISVVIIVGLFAVWKFMGSSNWTETKGTILKSEYKEIYNNPATNTGKTQYDYLYTVEYEYTFNGMTRKGSKIYPGLPNLFTKITEVEKISNQFPVGKSVSVYVNPNNADDASLIIHNKNEPFKFVIFAIVILMIFGIFMVAFKYANKFLNM